jgi:hypothetical protein
MSEVFKGHTVESLVEVIVHAGPALRTIFETGIEIKEKIFYEFTEPHYQKLRAEQPDCGTGRWYMVLPENNTNTKPNEVLVVNEEQKASLLTAAQLIEVYCTNSRRSFASYIEKLAYTSNALPPILSATSPVLRRMNMRVVE